MHTLFFTERSRRQLLESFLNLTSDGIVVVNREGRVLDINKRFEELHGWSREDIIGRILPVTPEEQRQEVRRIYQRIADGEHFAGVEMLRLRKDGSRFYASVTISPIKDEDGNVIAFVGVERDISEKKHVEHRLVESEERYRILVETLPEPVIVCTDFHIMYANIAAARLIGSESPESLIGQYVFRFVHPNDIADLLGRILALDENGKATGIVEQRLIRKDGSVVEVEAKAVAVRLNDALSVQLLFRDVTERKRMEEELLERERQNRKILKLSPEPIILHRDGMIQFVNEIGTKLLGGGSMDEFVGRSIFAVFCPSSHEAIRESMRRAMLTDEFMEFVEMKLRRLDGVVLDVEVSSIYIHKNVGEPVTQMVIRDMTDRKKAEELLRRSEKLSIIGQLAAGVAHEIRNPLTALKGFTQLLKSSSTAYVDIMLDELARIEHIVNEFMTLAKPQAVQYRETSVRELLASVVDFMQPQAILLGIQIDTRIEVDERPVFCDANQIKQVIINLLKNAMEAMPHGGPIEVSALATDRGSVLIGVADRGIGIPEGQLARIGEPFFSMKDSGNGLGLMVCQRIVDAHKGRLSIRSKVGEGTTVEIELFRSPSVVR